MSDNTGPVPAGWFADPSGEARQRYWDGTQWTQHFHPPLAQQPAASRAPKVKKSRKGLTIGLIAGALVLVLGVVSFLVFGLPALHAGFNGRIYTDVSAEYDYTDEMLDIDPAHVFEFPIDFDFESKGAEYVPDFAYTPGSDWAFEVFIDPALTKRASALILQHTGSSEVSIKAETSTFARMFDGERDITIAEDGVWGLHSDYYLVRKIDSAGDLLKKPVVTHFTAAGELSAPVVTFGTPDNDGSLEFRWEKVENATDYLVVASKTTYIEDREYTVLGATSDTSWSSAETLDYESGRTPWVRLQNEPLKMFGDVSSDDVAGGAEGELDEESAWDVGVIAVNDVEYSPYESYDVHDVAAALPFEIAQRASEDLKKYGPSRLTEGIDDVQKTIAFTSLDGATRSTVAYIDGTKVQQDANRWVLPLMGRGTQLGLWVAVKKSTISDISAAVEKFNADAEAAAPTTGMPTFDLVAAPVDEFAQGVRQAPDTDYPIYGSNELTKFLAAHMIAQTPVVDLADFVGKPGLPEVIDAANEARYQNPYAINISGISKNADATKLYLTYQYTLADAEAIQAAIAKKVAAIVKSETSADMTDAKKVVALNAWLVDNSGYDDAAVAASETAPRGQIPDGFEDAWNAKGVLVDGLGVCASYAYAFNALANAAGVETTVVLGNVLAGGRHSWNKVKIDGKWLAVDPTWNDTLATDDYVMVPDTAFTGIAKRVEDKMWMSDQYLAGFATR